MSVDRERERLNRDARLLAFLERREGEVVALACELIATPSANPPGDERAVVAVLAEQAARLGLGEVSVHAVEGTRPNLVIRVRGGSPGRRLLLTGHTDTKPVGAGTESLWASDPLEPVVREGRLWGLGSADMKGALAAMLFAAAALKQCTPDFAGELILAFTADEEAGSRYGARYLASVGLVAADAALIGEPCGVQRDWERLCLVSRRAFGFKTTVYGTQTHSSLSDQLPVVNAVQRAAQVLDEMRHHLRLAVAPHPLYPEPVTYNFGVRFHGGVGYGVVPGKATFDSDIRLPPHVDLSDVARQIEAFVERLRAADSSLRIAIKQELPASGASKIEPFEIAQDHPLVKAVAEAARSVLGATPPFGGFPGGTDATQWHGIARIPSIPAFGPGVLPVCHGPNENVSLESLLQAAKMYALAASRYLSDD